MEDSPSLYVMKGGKKLNTYDEALSWIHGLLKFGIKPGLKRVQWLLNKTGNPEKKIKAIHIAGTNGKGSTVSYLRNIFNEAGYRAGTFTSPYLISFNERISIDGEPIMDSVLLEYAKVIRPFVEELADSSLGSPTEFEVITVISLLYFADQQPDIVIYETGLGGLYDSTNVITPLLSMITNIGYDHMAILGETIGEIAYQKSGIIKENIPVVTTVEQEEALEVIKEQAKKMGSEIFIGNQDFFFHHNRSLKTGEEFFYKYMRNVPVIYEILMKGIHQVKNASLALAALEILQKDGHYQFTSSQIKKGLRQASWAGRFEKVAEEPDIIIDGAHNLQGVQALKETIKKHYEGKRIFLLFAALQDKAYAEMMGELEEIVHEAYFTSFDFPRAASADQLMAEGSFKEAHAFSSWPEALETVKGRLEEKDVLIITGSLYFISEIRKIF
jgi:dihydrofolate synthase / folylpolyglutamate synthase